MKKELEEEYITLTIDMQKVNKKYIKDYDKNKESSYLKYWCLNNLSGWAMSEKLPVNDFKCVEIFPNLMRAL